MNIARHRNSLIGPAAGFAIWLCLSAAFCRADQAAGLNAPSTGAMAAFPYGRVVPIAASVADEKPLGASPAITSSTSPTTFSTDHPWTIEVLGTGLGDVTNRHVGMGGLTTGVGYYFFTNVAIEMELTGYGFNEGHSSGAAVGIALGIRHHIFHIRDNSFFLDVSGGEIEASNNLPVHGTHLNNTIQFGCGVAHPIAENCYLVAGVRYYHISNARSEGDDRNPSVNAIQGLVGVMWRF